MTAFRDALHAIPDELTGPALDLFGLEAATLAAGQGVLAPIAAWRGTDIKIGPAVEALMRKARIGVGFQAERVRRGWDRALDILDGAGVISLPLKGRSLALRLYGDASLRYSSDVDLLIGRGDLERALEAFKVAGYTMPAWVQPRFYVKAHHHILLTAPDRLPPVELHFALSSGLGGGLDSPVVMARSRVQSVGGRAIRVMEPEDEFVYLATHAAMHSFAPMGALLDLKLLALRSAVLGAKATTERPAGLNAVQLWRRALDGEVSIAVAVAVELARYWAGLRLELPVEPPMRMRLVRTLFPDWAVASGFYSPDRHKYAAWLPPLVMTDRPSRASRSFAQNVARGAKRHARKRLGSWLPEEWSD